MDKNAFANAEFSKFSRNYMELKKNLPIRPSEMGVLNILEKTPGPHTPILLAELLGVSKAMIATHLSVLMNKGYIIKQQSPYDKRSFYVLATQKAKELVNNAEKDLNEHLDKLILRLGEDNFNVLVKLISEANEVLRDELEIGEGEDE